jgi:hypothetical protein
MNMEYFLYAVTIISLIMLGAVSGKSGGTGIMKPIIWIVILGDYCNGIINPCRISL